MLSIILQIDFYVFKINWLKSIETDTIDFTPNMENGFDALIELRIEAKEAGNMTCNGTEIKLKDMPYAV